MTLPAGFPAPSKHRFVKDQYDSADCLICSHPFDFGALHTAADAAGAGAGAADLAVESLPSDWEPNPGVPADLYGSATDPSRCECGISLEASARGGWRTPGCRECTHRLWQKVAG